MWISWIQNTKQPNCLADTVILRRYSYLLSCFTSGISSEEFPSNILFILQISHFHDTPIPISVFLLKLSLFCKLEIYNGEGWWMWQQSAYSFPPFPWDIHPAYYPIVKERGSFPRGNSAKAVKLQLVLKSYELLFPCKTGNFFSFMGPYYHNFKSSFFDFNVLAVLLWRKIQSLLRFLCLSFMTCILVYFSYYFKIHYLVSNKWKNHFDA
jgi:hypothetical protein